MLDSISIKLPLNLFFLKENLTLITLQSILFAKDLFSLSILPNSQEYKDNYELLTYISSLSNPRFYNLCENIIFFLFNEEYIPKIRIQNLDYFNYYIINANKKQENIPKSRPSTRKSTSTPSSPMSVKCQENVNPNPNSIIGTNYNEMMMDSGFNGSKVKLESNVSYVKLNKTKVNHCVLLNVSNAHFFPMTMTELIQLSKTDILEQWNYESYSNECNNFHNINSY